MYNYLYNYNAYTFLRVCISTAIAPSLEKWFLSVKDCAEASFLILSIESQSLIACQLKKEEINKT